MSALQRLATRLGVFDRFFRIDGVEVVTEDATRLALVRAMGFDVAGDSDAAEVLAALEAEDAARRMPREGVVLAERPGVWRGPHDRCWRLTLEDGSVADGDPNGDLPPLPPGVHVLEAEGETTRLIAAPASAPMVVRAAGRRRLWGATAALYGLMSERSLGRGDYADLAAAAEGLARLGADFLGINPVHDRGPRPEDLSPYSPSSRTGFDVTHVAPDLVPEFADCPEARAILAAAAEDAARAARDPLGDPALSARVVPAALDALFARFEATGAATGRRGLFDAWLAQGGEARWRQAVFAALSLRHGPDWRRWPEALRHPASAAVESFAQEAARDVRRAAWAQWVAERQIAAAQSRARGAGMALGLYLDIAVGVRPGGAETWADPAAFARGVSLGAPPDALNPRGQVWDLAPFSPRGLAAQDHRPFRAMLHGAMSHAGLVRIDHVIGLERAFWVPEDGAPGTYVAQPLEALLALVRLEAARTGCVVVGEDLGTVPEGFRDRMTASGLHGCAVWQFEREADRFARPADWSEPTLAAFGTHDTPTLAGWWEGRDIDDWRALGHLTAEEAAEARESRAAARAALARRLREEGALPAGVDADAPPARLTADLADAVHAALAGAGSALVAVQLDDALRETAQRNLPGTTREAPNWRLRHRAPSDRLDADPDLRRTAAILSAARPRAGEPPT